MTTVITILHIAVSIFLILVVLLQTGKGAEMGAAFGSGQAVFGAGAAASGFRKITSIAAIIFMSTSIGLTILGRRGAQVSVVEQYKPPVIEEQKTTEEKPGEAVETPQAPQTPAQPVEVPTQ